MTARKERLAINLIDLDRIYSGIRSKMLAGRLDLARPIDVEVERAVKSKAVVFTCDLLTAALVIDLIRNECRREGDEPIRAYIFREAWTRLPGLAILTVQAEGKSELNPEIFPVDVRPEDIVPLPQKRVTLGRRT